MKILHISNHFHPCVGGIERAVEGLCKSLLKRGHVSDVACLDTCAYTDERLLHFEKYENIRIFRFHYLNLRFYKLAPGVLKLLRDYDVIHVHGVGFFSDYLAITKSHHKKPLILTTHGGFFHTKKLKRIKRLYFVWNRFSLRVFEKVIAVSRNDEAIFSTVYPGIEHIPNGILVDEFLMKRKSEPHMLLYVGRISKNKRIDRLIETVALLKKRVPEVKLKIAGEDWEGIQKELEKLAEKRGVNENVEFLGKIKRAELIELLSETNFFVSASEYEGFGISAIEGMAAGCIVVLNDIPAFREFVNHGKNGFLVDFEDYESATTLLDDLIGKDLSEVSKEAKKTASGYDWKSVVKRIEKVYAEALEKKRV